MSGKLYIIPTPIGNLEDITLRALRLLKEVDIILAEDTRETGKLLNHFEIKKPLRPYHKFNEHKTVHQAIEALQGGQQAALVSDAGTPAISDPGYLIVKEALANNIAIECLPGATAFVPALVVSGLPNDKFCFEGFLPQKKGRQKRLTELEAEQRTMIFYESPYRIIKALEQMAEHFGEDRQASASREISKMFEETARGTLKELIAHFQEKAPKGEFVLIVAGAKD